MKTTNSNSHNKHDHDHGQKESSAIMASHHNSENNHIFSIMHRMDALPSSLERSCSIIDLSLSLADLEEDTDIYTNNTALASDGTDYTDCPKEKENKENHQHQKKEENEKNKHDSIIKDGAVPSTPSILLPRSAARLPLLPRRGLFQQQPQDASSQQQRHRHNNHHNHERVLS